MFQTTNQLFIFTWFSHGFPMVFPYHSTYKPPAWRTSSSIMRLKSSTTRRASGLLAHRRAATGKSSPLISGKNMAKPEVTDS
jgi:hypothetical protein